MLVGVAVGVFVGMLAESSVATVMGELDCRAALSSSCISGIGVAVGCGVWVSAEVLTALVTTSVGVAVMAAISVGGSGVGSSAVPQPINKPTLQNSVMKVIKRMVYLHTLEECTKW